MAQKFKFSWDKVKEDIKSNESGGGSKNFQKDERFWTPTKNEDGNGTAIIRFLPDMDGTPFVKIYNHGFPYQNNGKKFWWIRNCINTFGYDQKCPICEKNMELWNSAFESDKSIASSRKRKLQYYSNIMVIKNPNKPEDEGKIFLYKYGKKIFDKIAEKMNPTEDMLLDEDYVQFVPFDLYTGSDFLLTVTSVAGDKTKGDIYNNYDKSKFSKQKPLFGGDDKKIEDVMGKTHLLSEFIDIKEFPTNEEVVKSLSGVLGIDADSYNDEAAKPQTKKKEPKPDKDVEEVTESTTFDSDDEMPSWDKSSDTKEDSEDSSDAGDSEDDDFEFFKNLK